jgi:hypothetical protein
VVVDRVVSELVRELTSSLRPALTGGEVAWPTRRPGGTLDLSPTVARSLRTVRVREDGSPQHAPDRLVFRTRARPSPLVNGQRCAAGAYGVWRPALSWRVRDHLDAALPEQPSDEPIETRRRRSG